MPVVSDYTALLYPQAWNGLLPATAGKPIILTYSFSTTAQPYLLATGYSQAFIDTFRPFTASERNSAVNAFNQWAAASGIIFLEAPAGTGMFQLGFFDTALRPGATGPAGGFAATPNRSVTAEFAYMYSNGISGDVFIDTRIQGDITGIMLHEIGHGLGLKHPFEGDTTLAASLDNRTQTVMSYTGNYAPGTVLGPLDIAAIQNIYGANSADASNLSSWSWDAAKATLTQTGTANGEIISGVYSADRMDGGAGADTLLGDNGADTMAGGDGSDLMLGGADDDVLAGGDGNDTIGGGEGRDTLTGGAGNDDLYGNSGYFNPDTSRDTVDYSATTAGIDVRLSYAAFGTSARYFNARGTEIGEDLLRDLPIVIGGAGRDRLDGDSLNNELRGGPGADTLNGLQGNDVLLGDGAVVPTPAALAIHRLYVATLGRAPDDAGWAYWTDRLASGQALNTISSGFVGSQEFAARYQNPDNAGFVTLLYQNVFGRVPDAAGFQAWLGALNGGMTRNQAVVEFSESAEFRNQSDWIAQAGQIYRIYGATLARTPDTAGFSYWSDQMVGGRVLDAVAAGFVGSAEFQQTYRNLDNTQFVTLLYQNVLGRTPDAGGLANWKGKLDAGESRTSVVLGFSESGEYKTAKLAPWLTFMKTAAPSSNDSLDGAAGNDTLAGGSGADVFSFFRSDAGNDVIQRLEPWDTLRLVGFGYANKAAALAKVTQQGPDVVFSDQGETITFIYTTLNTVQQADWIFV